MEFRDVSFTYPDGERAVLKNISFRVEKGQTVAVVGASGCGKSTLLGLAARLYTPAEGQILVDGVDVQAYCIDSLCDKLGYAPQKEALFSGSVRSNIYFGESLAASREDDLWEALRLAQADDIVKQLPHGLYSRVESGGRNFSQDHRQRLSIARALARKPEILVLDDCFSALDHRTWRNIQVVIKEELQDITVLLAAQHIDTVREADRILVLEQGRLVGQGRHSDLLNRCPAYRELVQAQSATEVLEVE